MTPRRRRRAGDPERAEGNGKPHSPPGTGHDQQTPDGQGLRAGEFAMPFRTACALAAATVVLVVPSGAAASAADQCAGALDTPTNATVNQAADTIACLVNAERVKRGLKPVTRDADLGQAARRHALNMVRRGFFSHVTPGGSDLGDRLRDAGYGAGHGWRAGEALGWGTGKLATPNALVDEWLDSPPHRRILLDSGFRELGVGVAAGEPRDTQSDAAGATYALDFGVIRG
jgi:uncharacterized protein YkwD